ncbi:glycosyltransferase [Naasia lichenicola]|uniref:D-inositol 3-phosphate glycosyltransferase n=1 Tax=Naasia lichenicola TaxID=2565933 RepID=A0A4S4FDJ3_9MICO|nr:glycosyltransferase [Naasia lichenicola]THG28151.1 glycosyltransferase family 4 protein [Naasia lichenicola]
MVGDTFPPDVNGASNFSVRLAAGLARRGHNVHVVAQAHTWRQTAGPEEHEGATFTVHRLRSTRWPGHDWIRFVNPLRINANMRRIIREVNPDVLHSQAHLLAGRGGSTEAIKVGLRIVNTNHFMPENLIEHTGLPKFIWPLGVTITWKDATRILKRASAITTPTRRAADYLESKTGLHGVHAVSCGIRAADYTPSFEPRTENRVAFTGRVTGEKQIDKLLEAVAIMPADLNTIVDIIGDGDQRKALEEQAVRLGIADRVIFHGRVSDAKLRSLLTGATVFAMPSIAELQSISTMEAMASGLPIVAADAMALPHLVHDGENGFLFPPGDIPALAERLERVLRLPEDELAIMKNASLRLIEPHDIETTLDVFERLYRGEDVDDPVTEVPPLSSKLREQFRGLRRRARDALTD